MLQPWPPVTVPLTGGGTFPVRRVFCVGRNYAEHAREMGHDAREAPFFFGKWAESLTVEATVPYPPATTDLHHEVELVVALGDGGRAVEPHEATSMIAAYAVGIDLTRRDLQAAAKKAARPWLLAKAWIGAAPIGPLAAAAEIGHPRRGAIRLEVDGEARQQGDLAEMIWSVDEIVAELSRQDTLLPGDLIFTGTPAGVGPVAPGSTMRAVIEGLPELRVAMAEADV